MRTIKKWMTVRVWEGERGERNRCGTREQMFYLRLPDAEATRRVAEEGWEFCPKREWKTKVRKPIEQSARQL